MADTEIEWCDKVWNPVTGCSEVSQGCKNCFAERIFERHLPEMNGQKFNEVRVHEDRLVVPTRWRKPQRVFVNSMSDLFHPDVPDLFIRKVMCVIAAARRHTFMVLTKRPERMLQFFSQFADPKQASEQISMPVDESDCIPDGWDMDEDFECYVANSISGALGDYGVGWPMRNLWLGVSVENQAAANERIPLLLQTPAAVRFVSVEPMLGAIDLTSIRRTRAEGFMRPLDGRFNKLDWVICGGESGPGARPMHPDWARSLRDQCQAARVPFLQSKSEQRAAAELCRLNLGCIVGCRDDLTPSAFRAKRMPEAELINLFSLPKAARK